jgi:uncharacterized protein YmfQ (DUF2313 family)
MSDPHPDHGLPPIPPGGIETIQGPPPQTVCGFTGEDYAQVLADLLPLGVMWPREPGTILMEVWRALAEEYARVHERDCDLLNESYPGIAIETLPDWERICGLPDPCVQPPLDTIEERRAAILAKLAARGGQSRQYYIDLAKILGYDITITEYRPFLADQGRAEDRVYHQSNGRRSDTLPDPPYGRDNDWWFVWGVNCPVLDEPIEYFRCDVNRAEDRLATWGNTPLECMIAALKPAHTYVIHTYAPLYLIWDEGASIWDGGASIWDQQGFDFGGRR